MSIREESATWTDSHHSMGVSALGNWRKVWLSLPWGAGQSFAEVGLPSWVCRDSRSSCGSRGNSVWDQSCHQVWDYPVNGGKSVMLQHKVGGVAEARDGAQRSRIPMYNVAKKVRIIPVVRSPPPPPPPSLFLYYYLFNRQPQQRLY